MRNMIFKTLFASILGSLFIAPLAHADRQGGGTLRAAFEINPSMLDTMTIATGGDQIGSGAVSTVEWVKFKKHNNDSITFDYSWAEKLGSGVTEVTIDRAELQSQHGDLVRALSVSKANGVWVSTFETAERK